MSEQETVMADEVEFKANTKRPTIKVNIDGIMGSLRKHAIRLGIPHSTVTARYRRGVRGAALVDLKGIRRQPDPIST